MAVGAGTKRKLETGAAVGANPGGGDPHVSKGCDGGVLWISEALRLDP